MKSFLIRDILNDAQAAAAAAAAANNMAQANAALAALAAQHQHHQDPVTIISHHHNQHQQAPHFQSTTNNNHLINPLHLGLSLPSGQSNKPKTNTLSPEFGSKHHSQSSATSTSSADDLVQTSTPSTTNQQQQQVPPNFQLTSSPLDALFQMTSSTFDALKRGEKRKVEHTATTKQSPKKKRKSRTAFTNNQIYELERRFRIQKYLSPTDRDEIAMSLNLTNAQVITWFQNRRAKMKRDLEEQRRDIETASLLNLQKIFLESFRTFSQLKGGAIEQDQANSGSEMAKIESDELYEDNEDVDVETNIDSE